jgi:hypothetical protein
LQQRDRVPRRQSCCCRQRLKPARVQAGQDLASRDLRAFLYQHLGDALAPMHVNTHFRLAGKPRD